MTLAALHQAVLSGDSQLSLPLAIALPAGRTLHCQRLLRLLPGKRAVLVAELEGRTVLAKFFTEAASRQLAREAAGYRRLEAASQPTPALQEQLQLAQGTLRLYRYLPDAVPLFDADAAPEPTAMTALLDRLAAMYRAGIWQADLHGGNFLCAQGELFVIDPGAVEGEPGQPLAPAQVRDNLGLLVAQFRRCDQSQVLQAIGAHPVAALAGEGDEALRASAEAQWQRRKNSFLQKIFRNSSAIGFGRRFDRVWAWRREGSGAEFEAFVSDPDAFMRRGILLKDGNSATVVRVHLDGREVVIKRYNLKGFTHWLRRFWRPSRAWVSWRNAHLLALVGIDTPAPVAMFERRWGPLRRNAYYLCECVVGEELFDAARRQPLSESQNRALRGLFAGLRTAQLQHGDLKARNILVDDRRAWLIDLDALREITNPAIAAKWHAKDVARFLRNWEQQPELLRQMREVCAS